MSEENYRNALYRILGISSQYASNRSDKEIILICNQALKVSTEGEKVKKNILDIIKKHEVDDTQLGAMAQEEIDKIIIKVEKLK